MGVLLEKTKRYFINKVPVSTNISSTENRMPFFIVGSGRNGSTLLSAILNNHQDIFIPPEHYALPNVILRWHYNWYSNNTKKISDLLQLFLSRSYHWKIRLEEAQDNLLSGDMPIDNFYDFIYQLYRLEARHNQKTFELFGDKTPYNTFYIPLLLRCFNHSKFIFLQRDPRDFAASMRKMKPNISLENIIYRWEYSLKGLQYLQDKNNQVLVCRYEDLVTHPSTIIDQVVTFLNIQPQQDMLQSYQQHLSTLGVSASTQHSNIYNPINAQSIGNYKTILSADEIKIIERKFHAYCINA